MKRLALVATIVLGLVLSPGPARYQCGSDADCATFGVVVCALCPASSGSAPPPSTLHPPGGGADLTKGNQP